MEFSRQLHNCASWIFSLVCAFLKKFLQPKECIAIPPSRPVSVNYHFTRQCNYACKFCFHTALTSFVMPLHEAKHGLKLMAEAGMKKINFSGGEPFLVQRGKFLGELVKYCKRELQLESVTIVTNGSLVTQEWFESYGEYLDILAVSCDSFNEDVNRKNGRHAKGKNHLETLEQVGFWCAEFGVLFKINSVITIHNYKEDMMREIERLNPVRWKVFQCLLIDGENAGEGALRDARELTISDEQFELFSAKHRHLEQFVPESNEAMRNSYLLLDEYMRFLDNRDGKKTPSKSILDVGVERALKFSGFDEQMFKKRGGRYKWSKADTLLQW